METTVITTEPGLAPVVSHGAGVLDAVPVFGFTTAAYVVAAVLFILALGGLALAVGILVQYMAGGTRWVEDHLRVLPLCAGHHQDGTGIPGLIAVHPWKRRFEDRYGSQDELLQRCHGLLAEVGAA